jgi:hypothetical protein
LHADELWYDDEERYAKYLVASKARQEDMARMAKNTARIVTNRQRAEERAIDEAAKKAAEDLGIASWNAYNAGEGP